MFALDDLRSYQCNRSAQPHIKMVSHLSLTLVDKVHLDPGILPHQESLQN